MRRRRISPARPLPVALEFSSSRGGCSFAAVWFQRFSGRPAMSDRGRAFIGRVDKSIRRQLLFKTLVLIVVGISWGTAGLQTTRGQVIESGFESLFDGQTLNGWRKHLGLPKGHVGGRWEVIDGAVTGFQDPPGKGGFLVTDREFGDFILRLDTQLDYPVDSGVFLRVGKDGRSHQVTLDHRPEGDIGAIYLPWTQGMVLPNPRGGRAFREDQWNQVGYPFDSGDHNILWLAIGGPRKGLPIAPRFQACDGHGACVILDRPETQPRGPIACRPASGAPGCILGAVCWRPWIDQTTTPRGYLSQVDTPFGTK